ncbi:ExbD/TolR family protein [Cognatiluteimonas weifangensis]|uniref:Biopolymer transporter ExbD n=1 Tax=Cognatiluteimonas weifangensis TaxID=2303539 RepID=A0A372DPE7_9GAMM|nr:biopolymer transporter ExbD [Luteimonas weifangensis]RFP61440.1 biopolymer transporter ExbD [Luteimonas weifangensis]
MDISNSTGEGLLVDMNIIPLADVLLVLLIIFMVTAPTPSYPIDIDLPQRSLTPPPEQKNPPEPIDLRIDAAGQVYWNDSPAPVTALQNMMEAEVERDPNNQPTLQIDTDEDADYGILAKVLAAARNAQMQKIGFVKK